MRSTAVGTIYIEIKHNKFFDYNYEKVKTMNKLAIKEILTLSGVDPEPSYYSGRPATLSDLNSKILEKIYRGIAENISKEAADNYLQLVDELEYLSATAFLKMIYRLEQNEWKFDYSIAQNNSNTAFTSPGTMFGTFGSRLGQSNSCRNDVTIDIKREFLRSHGIKI